MNNFTPRAQQVLALARKEADRFNHNYVGTEHLLLGLIKLGQGVAVNVLQKVGLDLETVRMEVEKQVGSGPETKMVGNIPYTPRVKKVLALAGKEAKARRNSKGTRSEFYARRCRGRRSAGAEGCQDSGAPRVWA
jgi:ATP-dependent Clp protease ATP-binding subunit ClpC